MNKQLRIKYIYRAFAGDFIVQDPTYSLLIDYVIDGHSAL